MSKTSKQELIFLELGQIIQINATENLKIHEKIFIIDYLDDQNIELIQQDDLSRITLNILDGSITDETIENLNAGTYTKSFYTVMYSPDCAKISVLNTNNSRIHHKINWNNAVPCLISDTYKK